ncbi:MAG: sulfate adenylyltransferase, partial [Bacteroidota bacterium]
GDVIGIADDPPSGGTTVRLMTCWMNPKPLQLNGKYALRHNTRDARCIVRNIEYVLNINTLEKKDHDGQVRMNEIACLELQCTKPLIFDPYSRNRFTGSLIIIDESTNETIGAGMIL